MDERLARPLSLSVVMGLISVAGAIERSGSESTLSKTVRTFIISSSARLGRQ